jgi:hypothetical protein
MKVGLLVLLTCFTRSLAATPKEYEAWFGSSSNGLAMSSSDAAAWARSESAKLADSGITVPALQNLRNTLYLTLNNGLGLSLPEVRQWILPLAYAHSSPQKLGSLFQTLWLNFLSFGGLDLPKSEAQSRAIDLSLRQVEPEVVKALYGMLYGTYGLNLPQPLARTTAIEQAAAGADAATFKEAYLSAQKRGLPQSSCLAEASREAVKATLQGLVRRHAKDTIPYTAAEFQSHYGDSWLNEWLSSPLEQRVAQDGFEYTAAGFAQYYGSSWVAQWSSSKVATQVRIAPDGKHYTMKEFADYYKNDWQKLWEKAPETRCQECLPYPDQSHEDLVVQV